MIERKTTAATATAGVTAPMMLIVAYYLLRWRQVQEMPAEVRGAVLTLATGAVTALLTFAGSWLARHTPRPDLRGEVIDGVTVLDTVAPPPAGGPGVA